MQHCGWLRPRASPDANSSMALFDCPHHPSECYLNSVALDPAIAPLPDSTRFDAPNASLSSMNILMVLSVHPSHGQNHSKQMARLPPESAQVDMKERELWSANRQKYTSNIDFPGLFSSLRRAVCCSSTYRTWRAIPRTRRTTLRYYRNCHGKSLNKGTRSTLVRV